MIERERRDGARKRTVRKKVGLDVFLFPSSSSPLPARAQTSPDGKTLARMDMIGAAKQDAKIFGHGKNRGFSLLDHRHAGWSGKMVELWIFESFFGVGNYSPFGPSSPKQGEKRKIRPAQRRSELEDNPKKKGKK